MKALTRILMMVLSLVMVVNTVPGMAFADEGAQQSRDSSQLKWETISFGQSTDLNFSANVLPGKIGTNYAKPEVPGTIDGAITLESRGGKLAPGHDGLTFYYTKLNAKTDNFVLEADLTIEQFGPETGAAPNGQESAGIMVRDAIAAPRQDPMILGYEEVPAASNIFGVGMMRHGISPIYRTGVVYPWGNLGSQLKATGFTTDPAYTLPIGTPVRVKLERTDTEFIMSTTFTHLSEKKTFEQRVKGADLVQVLDPDHMYVGFYAARNAKMTVTNASLTLSDAHTVATPPTPPAKENAAMNIVSAPETGSADYTLKTLANYDGTIAIAKDGKEVVSNAAVLKNEVYSFAAKLDNDTTDFTVVYTPKDAPSTASITKTIQVTKKIFNKGAGLFVSPTGKSTAKGTLAEPMDLETAIKYVLPGETIFMREGIYSPSAMLNIKKEYSGEKDKLKTLAAYNGEKVTIDGQAKLTNVIQLNGDYWHVAGFHVTGATSNGMRVSGDHNVVEQMLFNYNGDTGLQITGSGTNPDLWPKYNLILNCESHDNRDPRDEDADGFAAKLGVGEGNVFKGNIAHHNIDDGWDLYNRTNEGANKPITLDGNIAYSNGKLSDGYNKDGNMGNGFKLGGEGLPVAHIVRNNLSFDNNMDGFTDNFNPGKMIVENNTSFDNKRFNFVFRINPYFTAEEQGIFKNNLSFRTKSGAVPDFISGAVDETNFFYDGTKSVNSKGTVVTEKDFASLQVPAAFARAKNGTIQFGDFLRLAPKSGLNKAGTGKSYVGALAANPVSIKVEGPDSIREGETAQLVVKGVYADGSVKTLTADIVYSSKDAAILAVNEDGSIQAGKKGKTMITVSYHGLKEEHPVHVKNMPPGQKKKQ
ncbi:right-handed parallel beta-helix repeat-containing protein [Neobacillus sp. NPDC093127]|uniref:right-handed parallel beta-helix repeat-containing protein n=1 Tax=Neobacillus sp. NPDC093127 TaxID=3364296 RepID=UPI003828E977